MTETLFDLNPSGLLPVWPKQSRYLLSYAYIDDRMVDVCRKNGTDLVIDSGAFTAAASGKEVDHDGYLDWLLANSDAVTFALSLDVIGDHETSRRNHDYALSRIGDKVRMVPTYHLGSPFRELERLCDVYDFVSIGGAVPFARRQGHLMIAFQHIHRIAAERGTNLHGLGMTGNRVIHRLPWYSVDSSAWLSPSRFPSLPLAELDGWITQIQHGWDLTKHERTLVEAYGLDPDIVATPGWSLKAHVGPELAMGRRIEVLVACARAYMYAEATKGQHQPNSPIRVYMSGNTGNFTDGAPGILHLAHQAGSPYPAIYHHTHPLHLSHLRNTR